MKLTIGKSREDEWNKVLILKRNQQNDTSKKTDKKRQIINSSNETGCHCRCCRCQKYSKGIIWTTM